MTDELAIRRFDKAEAAKDVRIPDALKSALAAYEEYPPEKRPSHVTIVFGYGPEMEEDPNHLEFFQGGNYGLHAQVGLMFDAATIMRDR